MIHREGGSASPYHKVAAYMNKVTRTNASWMKQRKGVQGLGVRAVVNCEAVSASL